MAAPVPSIDALRDLAERLDEALRELADADQAEPMARYMKDRFEFLGVKTPARRASSKALVAATRRADLDDVVAVVDALRAHPEREFHYVASDVLRANDRRLRARDFEHLARWITTDSWWDTVDALASPTVGTMVRNHPELAATLDDWVDGDELWLARTAIIHQLRYGDDTDAERLFRYALARARDTDFFIRKGIGWALRQYAHHAPDRVRAFVDEHRDRFSPLTIREATKHL
ncbi:MAG: DNA alkylation repair protein [Actinomycetota bacterium]